MSNKLSWIVILGTIAVILTFSYLGYTRLTKDLAAAEMRGKVEAQKMILDNISQQLQKQGFVSIFNGDKEAGRLYPVGVDTSTTK